MKVNGDALSHLSILVSISLSVSWPLPSQAFSTLVPECFSHPPSLPPPSLPLLHSWEFLNSVTVHSDCVGGVVVLLGILLLVVLMQYAVCGMFLSWCVCKHLED